MKIRLLLCSTFALLQIALPTVANADEVFGYGIKSFNGDSYGQCDAGNLKYTITQASNFLDEFDSSTWSVHQYSNTAVRGKYFTDESKEDRCVCSSDQESCDCSADDHASNKGTDDANVFFLSTHGSASDTSFYVSYSMGNSDYDCSVNTKNNILWADDLAIVAIDACHSGQYYVWSHSDADDESGFFQMRTKDSQLSTYLGYHGTAPDRTTISGFASNSFNNGIGENWLEYQYDGDGKDACPVAVVFGSSSTNRDKMFSYGGFDDRKDTGDKTGATYYYIEGCNPGGGDALPSD